MTTNHIDQLAEWWSEAERGPFRKGDMLIARREDECVTYEVYPAGCDHNDPAENVRILSRAPKPEPAWHNASAVIARTHAYSSPRVFAKDENGIWNDALAGRGHSPDALLDVTPLIEAKVTDEMVTRAQVEMMRLGLGDYSDRTLASILTAALGLDPA